MVTAKRSKNNPLFLPNTHNTWEAIASFNGSILKENGFYTMVYRALSLEHIYNGVRMQQSSIGICQSGDSLHFRKRKQFITPQEEWDKWGCEDPRITKLDDTYYVFYTGLSQWPPNADGIKVGVALSKDLEQIQERHLVTPFNAKAMAMFPEKINGKIVVVLTVHTDKPPASICLAYLDTIEQLWDINYWKVWYAEYKTHEIPITRDDNDHLEVGTVPVKTDSGWVLPICYIENYTSPSRAFRIDAMLLDRENPQKLIGQTVDPLLTPQEEYELYGLVPNVIFPSSAFIEEGQFFIYYSACDTTICRASITLNDLIEELQHNPIVNPHKRHPELLVRFNENPIISPIKEHVWESKYTFNAGAILLGDKIHILYRAMGEDDTSVLGYASSTDGLHITKRLADPVYTPRESFEMKFHPGFSGCEDPRLTIIGNQLYMSYTAYDGINPPRIAISHIVVSDFLNQDWKWSKPILISHPGIDDKDSCIEQISTHKYVIFHRLTPCIWVDFVTDLSFTGNHFLGGHPLMGPRANSWDDAKIGLNGPPIKTEYGWLLLYHGVSKKDNKYRMGAALLDRENPLKVLARLHNPILEPIAWYENKGFRPGTVFSNGHVVKDGILFVYYGGADTHTAVASTPLNTLLDALKNGR